MHRPGAYREHRTTLTSRMTPMSIDSGEPYPGQNLTISQLLHAAHKKLQGTIFVGERFVWISVLING